MRLAQFSMLVYGELAICSRCFTVSSGVKIASATTVAHAPATAVDAGWWPGVSACSTFFAACAANERVRRVSSRTAARAAEAALSAASAASGALLDALQRARAAGDAISPAVLAALEELPQRLEFDDDSYDPDDAELSDDDDSDVEEDSSGGASEWR